MLRQDLFDQIRPLDQAQSLTVKTVLVADLFHLLHISDAVHIKMIKRHTALLIDLYNGKGGAVDRFRNSKTVCHSLAKYCLAHTQITDQGIDLPGKCF